MNLLGAAFGTYLALVGGVFVMQRSLMYPADRAAPDVALAAAAGMDQVTTATHDGLRLAHWYRPPQSPEAPVLVAFHGNGGHIGHRVPKLAGLIEAGLGLLLAEYRGYGGNPGRPTEDDLTADARTLLEWLLEQGIAAERIVLYGESLGTGLAVKLAAEHEVGAVILESPYTSIAEVAQMHYWYLPARWLVLDRWDAVGPVGRLRAPLLVLHGGQDSIIPPRYGRRLFEAAPEPKEYVLVEGAGHNDVFDFPQATQTVLDFLRRRLPNGA